MKQDEKVVVVGAGPAGLTLAYELLKAGYKNVVVYESDTQVGGISKTVNHNGNRIDIGGHRFFSKSEWVMSWWENFLPVVASPGQSLSLKYQGKERSHVVQNPGSASADDIMLVRSRLSRIYYNQSFFDYPLKLTPENLAKLGLKKTVLFGLSYVWSHLHKITPELTLEDFFINRFGRKLYLQFFKEYTEKVWGVPCSSISADWGAQRVKSLSIVSALIHAAKTALGLEKGKKVQTSLIEQFIYPKFGPGQMWEVVAREIEALGGKIMMEQQVTGINIKDQKVVSVDVIDKEKKQETVPCDVMVSTMPVKDLVQASASYWPEAIRKVAQDLQYRDFITVGLLYNESDMPRQLKDNWIYIQEPGVNVGRVQIFNNWSPYLVKKPGTVWLGLEFFCKEGDRLWELKDQDMIDLACFEMKKIGLVSAAKAQDSIVVHVPKAYPGYFGESYKSFGAVREALDAVDNLFLIGRNGMHRYNNQDHSMLTAKEAADQIISGKYDKEKIWQINIGDDYHEEKK
ncbi:NAD(P)/FAD-dependent oxidoreductase [Komagataeibacter melomenusus]